MFKNVHVVIKYVEKKCMSIQSVLNYLYVERMYVELFVGRAPMQVEPTPLIAGAMSKMIDTNKKQNPGSQGDNDNQCSICFESNDGIYAFLPCEHACA